MNYPWLVIPLFFTAATLLIIGGYSLRFRTVAAAGPFTATMFLGAIWAGTYALEIMDGSLVDKIFLLRIRLSLQPFMPVTMLTTALEHAHLSKWLEKQYKLTEVLSPRKFQSPQERLLPRHDTRKEKLRTDIRRTLEKVSTYAAFEQQMKALGYKVIKGRGISFIDDKKVKIKGSEVGFSLAAIERILSLKEQITAKQKAEKPSVHDVA